MQNTRTNASLGTVRHHERLFACSNLDVLAHRNTVKWMCPNLSFAAWRIKTCPYKASTSRLALSRVWSAIQALRIIFGRAVKTDRATAKNMLKCA